MSTVKVLTAVGCVDGEDSVGGVVEGETSIVEGFNDGERDGDPDSAIVAEGMLDTDDNTVGTVGASDDDGSIDISSSSTLEVRVGNTVTSMLFKVGDSAIEGSFVGKGDSVGRVVQEAIGGDEGRDVTGRTVYRGVGFIVGGEVGV